MRTIGLLGGMSAESSAVYYKLINQLVRDRLGGSHAADCLLRSVDFADIEAFQLRDDWDGAADRMVKESLMLQAAGAELLVLCANTMHRVAGAIESAIDIPFVNIIDVTAERLLADGHTRVGLLATGYTMAPGFYSERMAQRHGIETIAPSDTDRAAVHRIIYDELTRGITTDASRDRYRQVISALAGRDTTALILGCTEIGLLIGQADSLLPIYDTAVIHAEAAVELALT